MVTAEEKSQHHKRRDEVPAEDSPRLERVEQPRPQDHHGGEDGHLEAAEEHEDTEQQMSLTLGQCEEACDHQPEDRNASPWTAVYLRTMPGVIVRAAGSRRPSKSTAPSSAGVRSGAPATRSSTKNQTATAAAPASPTRIPS